MQFHSKRMAALAMSGVMLASMWMPVFGQSNIYEERSTQPIGSGVTYQHILRFGDSGWLNINEVTINLKNPDSLVDVVNSPRGVTGRDTVATMANQKSQPLAATNADFFYNLSPDSPLGVVVRDGKMVSSPVIVKNYNALSITGDGRALFGPWTNSMNVTTAKGATVNIGAYNKITWHYNMTTIVDKNWGASTPGATPDYPDMVEVVVNDGKVTEVRSALASTAIPQNGYVILASGSQGQMLAQNFAVGDAVQFNPTTTPALQDVRMAVGGGNILVRDGQIGSGLDGSIQPRTAVGANAAGDHLVMVTVDGRNRSYTGVTEPQMAALMLELGCTNAMAFDGGGSTTMLKQDLGTPGLKLINSPSDGSMRRVIDSLVVSSVAPKGTLSGIIIRDGQDRVFKGFPAALQVIGYDTANQPFDVAQNDVVYSVVSGKGRIVNHQLIPDGIGTLVIQASYQGKTVQKSFAVLSTLAAIHLDLASYRISAGESLPISVVGTDAEGYQAPLAFEGIQFSDDSGLGTFQSGAFVAGTREGTTIIRATAGKLQAAAPLAVGLTHSPAGPLEKFAPTFAGYPAEVQGQVSMAAGGKVNATAIRLDYDFTGSTASTAAYAVLGNGGFQLGNQPHTVGVWVNSDSTSSHWIRGQVRDSKGKTQTIDFTQGITWTGWQYLEAELPNLDGAAVLERLYVVEPDSSNKNKGTLLFDGLEVLNNASLPALPAGASGGIVKDASNQVPKKSDSKWMVYGGSVTAATQKKFGDVLAKSYSMAILTGTVDKKILNKTGKVAMGTFQGYNTSEIGDSLIVLLNDDKSGLRKTDYNQWPWLKNLVASTTKKNVYVFVSKPIFGPSGFTDTLEAKLLGDQLTALSQRGSKVFVFYGGSSSTGSEVRNGVHYISTGKDSQYVVLYKSGGNTYYSFEKIK